MKRLCCLALVMSLTGCLPVAFLAGAATCVVVYDHRNSKTMLADKQIAFAGEQAVCNDRRLQRDKAHLAVTSFNRIVLVVGQVSTPELQAYAGELIRKCSKRIRLVYNEVTVGVVTSKATRAKDSWITAKAKARLIATARLNSSNLKIITENGVVYLLGLTTKAQGELAVKQICKIDGVKRVVKLFEYLN